MSNSPVIPSFTTKILQPYDKAYGSIQAGDFFLIKGKDVASKLIAFGQSLRYHNKDSQFTYYTHGGIFLDDKGTTIEASFQGVRTGTIDWYGSDLRKIVYLNISLEDRTELVNFARHCLKDSYGWLTIASLALSLLTGAKFSMGISGQEICSGLIARSLERTSFIPVTDASHIMPVELAEMFS